MSYLPLLCLLGPVLSLASPHQTYPLPKRWNNYRPQQDRGSVYTYLGQPMADMQMSPVPFRSMPYSQYGQYAPPPSEYHHGGHDHDGDGQPDHPHDQHPPHNIQYGPAPSQYHHGGHDHDGDGRPDHPHDQHPQNIQRHHGGHDHDGDGRPDHPHDQHPQNIHYHLPDAPLLTPPYQLVQQYPEFSIEERFYPSQKWACTKRDVDTAADPFAGLEDYDPMFLIRSKRYREGPAGQMKKLLSDYAEGQNSEGVVLARSQPLSVHHWVKKKLFGGDLEVQEMCFYLAHAYQGEGGERVPAPLDSSVYVFTRPAMTIYSASFAGVAVTEADWARGREALEASLARMGRFHHDREFFTNSYGMPHNHGTRRSEIWLQKLAPSPPVEAANVAEVDPAEDGAQVAGQQEALPGAEQEQNVFTEDQSEQEQNVFTEDQSEQEQQATTRNEKSPPGGR